MTWKEVVKDPNEIKVFMALDGPQHTWRTVGGIARQTGLPEERVWKILSKYNKDLTRLSEFLLLLESHLLDSARG
jgi:hypothetical protein